MAVEAHYEEVLEMYALLRQESTCTTSLFRFEKSEIFVRVQKMASLEEVVQIRLDDGVYLTALGIILITFGVIASSQGTSSLTIAYIQSLGILFICALIELTIPHWIARVFLGLSCLVYPIAMLACKSGFIPFGYADSNLLNCIPPLSAVVIFFLNLLIYPFKGYIRKQIGSLYSCFYGLAVSTLLYIWPVYSLVRELNTNTTVTSTFFTSNSALLTGFLICFVTAYYFLIHNFLFSFDQRRIRIILEKVFPDEQQLIQASESVSNNSVGLLLRHLKITSFGFYLLTVGSAVYVFLFLIYPLNLALIGYQAGFLIIGSVIYSSSLSSSLLFPIMALLSLIPAVLIQISSYYTTYYSILSYTLPFLVLFWGFMKSLPPLQLTLRINMIVASYLFLFFPGMAYLLSMEGILSSSATLTYICFSLAVGFAVVVIAFFLLRKIVDLIKYLLKKEPPTAALPDIDYFYTEEPDIDYVPYQVTRSFSLEALSEVDLRGFGKYFTMLSFLLSELLTFYVIRDLNTVLINQVFYSAASSQIVTAQLGVILLYYLYAHMFISTSTYLPMTALFAITAVVGIVMSYYSTAFSYGSIFIGGFSVFMLLSSLGFHFIRRATQKASKFIATVIVATVQVGFIWPYVEGLPIIAVYIGPSQFGEFVDVSILASLFLLVLFVGSLSLIFNLIMSKFEKQKKYKFIISEVETYFSAEGIQCSEEVLFILYESYQCRDRKYIYFLKRGFPLNLRTDHRFEITDLVTSDDYLNREKTIHVIEEPPQSYPRGYLWLLLTFCCGQDDEDLDLKLETVAKHVPAKIMNELMPKKNNLSIKSVNLRNERIQDVFSTKSLVLQKLHECPRYLSDDYVLLNSSKNESLAIEIWHNIFIFFANNDTAVSTIILSDFLVFIRISELSIDVEEAKEFFFRYANTKWKNQFGLNLSEFALTLEQLAESIFLNSGTVSKDPLFKKKTEKEALKHYMLTEKVYFNLCKYEQFNQHQISRKTRVGMSKLKIESSPFSNSNEIYQAQRQKREESKIQLIQNIRQNQQGILVEPHKVKVQIKINEEEQKIVKHSPSCKKWIYDKVHNCCKKDAEIKKKVSSKHVKPWGIICVEAIRILSEREKLWSEDNSENKNEFKLQANNILIALFKLLDIYTYTTISIDNPYIGWFSGASFTILYFPYTTQLYIALAVVILSVPFGFRGISLIFEDKLGLTDARLPAAFPHWMFFFTFLYKLMILSFFGIVSATLLTTFNCSWTDSTFIMYSDTSIVCFSQEHNLYILISAAALLIYYPLSCYAMPNFQFAEKSLQLKYRPSYLILYFQVNFVLLAGKVMLSTNSFVTQIIFNCLNILSLVLLAVSVIRLKPCLVEWFNYIELLTVTLGIIINICGFLLYLTGLWTIALILAVSLCSLNIVLIGVYLKRRYFSSNSIQVDEQNLHQVDMTNAYREQLERQMKAFDKK